MYTYLNHLTKKPAVFSKYTAKDLWTDEHISKNMLSYHLDDSSELASRSSKNIEKVVCFLRGTFDVNGKRIIDFGCGPGLYAHSLANLGAEVTGLDFSGRSIDYARNRANQDNLAIDYIVADYLEYTSDQMFDLALMVYHDLAVLSPDQRRRLLEKIYGFLRSGGCFIFDIPTITAFDERKEDFRVEKNMMNGFWSERDYFGIMQTFLYNDEKVAVDRFDIIETSRTRTIYNWLEYFDIKKMTTELKSVGFSVESVYSNLLGANYSEKNHEMAVVAKKSINH